jgi:hypothetical protein
MLAGIVIGAGLILAALGLNAWVRDKGLSLAWWHWLLLALMASIFLVGVAFLGTSLAEHTLAAGWMGLGISVVLAIILGTIVARTMRRTA